MPSLTRQEAQDRARSITVTSYDVTLDLRTGPTTFESATLIRFTGHQPGDETFIDIKAVEVHRVTLNGRELDPAAVNDGRLLLRDLAEDNELRCSATMAYSRDGQGLHRAVDPADGEAYVYGHTFLDAAPRVFACFDQPDLKAPYSISVDAPQNWQVLGNGAATRLADGRWELARTQPLATYFVTVCAGPYVSVRSEHDGIPLGLHARASLREPLERWAPSILAVTRASFDYYHSLFGIRYPFGEYHQVYVPEFNAGAMENPGCVTVRDSRLFRGAVTDDNLLSRARTTAHEMAHMWFGDLVTMRWWDDLWLNESFAEYMAGRTLVAATEFTDAWVSFGILRKTWGYAAERAPSTHPVAGAPALDADAALQDFDGISYAKGASVLRQLIAYVGDEAFVAGTSAYLREHAFGNGTLADFLGAVEQASGQDLSAWSKAWLLTADRDRLRVETTVEDGVITAATLRRSVPPDHPADRPHAVDVAGFTDGVEQVRLAVVVTGDETPLPQLVGKRASAVLVPNAGDLTWAGVDLTDADVAALPRQLAAIPDGGTRGVVWSALLDAVALASIDPRTVLALLDPAWVAETSTAILERVGDEAAHRLIPKFLPEREQEAARQRLAAAATRVLEAAEPESTRALVAAQLLATTTADEGLLRRWLTGDALPPGLAGDTDFRWLVLGNLGRRGLLDETELEQATVADSTMQGRLAALGVRASLPSAEAKAWAWAQLTERSGRSNHELTALATAFWSATDPDLVRAYVPRFFEEVPRLGEWVGEDALARVIRLGYPRVIEDATARLGSAALERTDLSAAVARNLLDGAHALGEALRSRQRYAP